VLIVALVGIFQGDLSTYFNKVFFNKVSVNNPSQNELSMVKSNVPPARSSEPNCLQKVKLMVEPKSESLSQFRKVKLTLTGKNTCKKDYIQGYILFKPSNPRLRVAPPIATEDNLNECNNPQKWEDCWQPISFNNPIEIGIWNPHLKPMVDKLETEEPVDINWVIKRIESEEILASGKEQVTITPDP
jgi:hypothetical protein